MSRIAISNFKLDLIVSMSPMARVIVNVIVNSKLLKIILRIIGIFSTVKKFRKITANEGSSFQCIFSCPFFSLQADVYITPIRGYLTNVGQGKVGER